MRGPRYVQRSRDFITLPTMIDRSDPLWPRIAAAGAVIPGVSVLQGAVIGAAVGGLAGAIWADQNNDGVVDGYVYNGQYYAGAPSATAPAPTYTAPPAARSGERG